MTFCRRQYPTRGRQNIINFEHLLSMEAHSEKFYYDYLNNPCNEEDAVIFRILEFDDNGKVVMSTERRTDKYNEKDRRIAIEIDRIKKWLEVERKNNRIKDDYDDISPYCIIEDDYVYALRRSWLLHHNRTGSPKHRTGIPMLVSFDNGEPFLLSLQQSGYVTYHGQLL